MLTSAAPTSSVAMDHAGRRPIRALPALLINQIAAGEVIERPASVVKELLDNAIDAGATRIAIEIESGGIELIRVIDDGRGVPIADAALMLAPHATSKIASAADLDSISTMGFRGEALASIVSVARCSVRSRTRDDNRDSGAGSGADSGADSGGAWLIDAEGDRISPPRPEAGPVGTCVTVRNLFFNTPARRKFLRTPATEQQRSLEVIEDLALAHPHIAFKASCDGRVSLDLEARDNPRERALDVLGRELEPQLLECSADRFDDARGLTLWGLVGTPQIARGTLKWFKVFINGRPVRDRAIQHAVQEAYRGLMPFDRKPTCVLLIEMAPGAVDVNVHPTKAEVRFRDSGLVHSVVLRAVREALRRADLTPSLADSFGDFGAPSSLGAGGASDVRARSASDGSILPTSPAINGAHADAFSDGARSASDGSDPLAPSIRARAASAFIDYFQRFNHAGASASSAQRLGVGAPIAGAPVARAQGSEMPAAHAHAPAADSPLLPAPVPASPVLQVHNSFVVTQDEHGLVIVDQHALHERVMFEAIMARLDAAGRATSGDDKSGSDSDASSDASSGACSGGLESQRLLTPATLDAPATQIELLERLRPALTRLGIDASPIGPSSIAIHAFPSLLFSRGVDAAEFLSSLLERAETEGVPDTEEGLIHEVVDMMACKAAIKAGDRMSAPELDALLSMRDLVERSSSCPHGRPTSIRLTVRELEKRFGRG